MSHPIDLSKIFEYLPKQDNASPNFYKINLPADVTSKLTYSVPPSQSPINRTNAQLPILKEIEDVVETPNTTRQIVKKKVQTVACSPYDFKQSYEIPINRKPIGSYDTQLQTANLKEIPQIKDIKIIGTTALFNKKLIGIRRSIRYPLPSVSVPDFVPIEEDPIIKEISSTPSEQSLRVFSTAKALASIAVCQRSVFPLDIQFKKKGNDIYVITSNNSPAIVETTLETITTQMSVQKDRMTSDFIENINETCKVNESFIQLSTEGQDPIKLGDESPLPLLYRSIVIGGIEFIIRSRIDALLDAPKPNKPLKLAVCRVFNDIPTPIRKDPWMNLEDRRGTIFINEVNANSAKVARWVTLSRLIGAEKCMIGYAIRKTSNLKEPHILLGVEQHGVDKFSQEISLTQGNVYGVLTTIFGRLKDSDDGKYLFIRDSKQRKTYSLYQI
ncbi:eukaryotic translation initiation factor 3 subunit D [Histomonas meleagridis]|uniref:eukaryotic translation initiation factor 3 subunit D n=1 Tax=Histomonas meleagridis TaxID=135588 RepID=UPI00355A9BF2|nr:eukaryotic translation initiation factor 3 subunit D [Histomonas meleagridis]KAH0801377.1 eukaryotic translation initiation factor 3 subunit D [Histomonas meleagridis]